MHSALLSRRWRHVSLAFVAIAATAASAVSSTVPAAMSRAAADPVPGCGTGDNVTFTISDTDRPWPLNDEGERLIYQSKCEANRTIASFRATADKLGTLSGVAGGGSIAFGLLKKALAPLSGVLGAGLAVGGVVGQQQVKNIADQLALANASCGDLGIVFTLKWVGDPDDKMQVSVSDLRCQAGPGNVPPQRQIVPGPFGFQLTPQEVDLAFVIDNTGSMDDDIAAVKSSATAIVDGLKREGRWVDYRVAVVTYNDPAASTLLSFSADKAAITGAVNSISVGGGGDIPEAVFSGIMTAVALPWRADAKKSIILMGDAPPHDPESGTGYTQASVTAAANGIGVGAPASTRTTTTKATTTAAAAAAGGAGAGVGVDIQSVLIGSDSSALDPFRQLAAGTGGELVRASSAADVVTAVNKAIDGAVLDPMSQVVTATAPWTEPVEWYGGTGTMTGISRVASTVSTQYVCDSDDASEIAFAFRLPKNVDRGKLRWFALNVPIDNGLTAAYGTTVSTVGSDGVSAAAAVLCLPDDGRLPADLATVAGTLRMSW